jgi:hypothetical protein
MTWLDVVGRRVSRWHEAWALQTKHNDLNPIAINKTHGEQEAAEGLTALRLRFHSKTEMWSVRVRWDIARDGFTINCAGY